MPWWLNEDGTANHEKLAIEAERGRMERNQRDWVQACELWAAGWTAETPHSSQQDIMSYYWRRPAKSKGRRGRLFLSTNQACNALRRERGMKPS